MALSEEQQTWLSNLLDRCQSEGGLSEWEQGFVNDQTERFEKYGATMFLSLKQLKVMQRIEHKLDGDDRGEDR